MPASATIRPSRGAFASATADHVGLRIPDLDAALAWYGEKLEFRPVGRTAYAAMRYVLIAPAENEDFRIELTGGPGAVDRPPHSDLMASLGQHGWHHRSRCGFFQDPWGNVIELLQPIRS